MTQEANITTPPGGTTNVLPPKIEPTIAAIVAKLPKWVRAIPVLQDRIRDMITAEAVEEQIEAVKITRGGGQDHLIIIRNEVAPWGDRLMRQITVRIHPTAKDLEFASFTEA